MRSPYFKPKSMPTGVYRLLSIFLLLTSAANGAEWFELSSEASRVNKRSLTVFYGKGTADTIIDILTANVDYLSYEMVAVAYTQEIAEFERFLYLLKNVLVEGEILYAYHYGDQVYSEITAGALFRLYRFPWNNFLKTTLCFGIGASYSSELPELDIIRVNNADSKTLIYLAYELTLAHPSWDSTEVVLRIHHRSGAWGLINDVSGGANFLNAGLRFRF